VTDPLSRQMDLLELVEWDNLYREMQGLPVENDEDVVSWALEPLRSVLDQLNVHMPFSRPTQCTYAFRRERRSLCEDFNYTS
jgi:hypothetical protein